MRGAKGPYKGSRWKILGVPGGGTVGPLAVRPKPHSRDRNATELLPRARIHEKSKMIPQNKNNNRHRGRSNGSRNARSTQAGQQGGPDLRGQWQHKFDHYCNLAQAAFGNDAVTREQYWQHAEHFLRLMNGSAD
jgi:hypothetical protein